MNNLADQPEIMEQDLENESPETQDVDSIEVEVVDDTPEEDRGKPRRADGSKPNIPEDDEISNYSEGVQKRIKQLKFEYHEERRQKEEASRMQEEALRYAQQVKAENEALRKNLDAGEETLIGQATARVQSELDKAKSEYKSAYEVGDPDLLLAAQERLTSLQVEQDRIKNYRPQKRAAVKPATPESTYQQQAPAKPQVDPRALEWGKKNTWFENPKNPEMTGYAYGVHQRLVQSGIDPNTDQYYTEIDKAMRQVFPDKFDDGQVEVQAPQRQGGPVVAAPSRTTKKSRTVRLTSTQASLAKRLGLSNEQYAAQLMKDQSK